VDDLSKIDLGVVGSPGGNFLQYPIGMGPNVGTGICLEIAATAGQTLNAQGNHFDAANCAAMGVTLMKSATCTGGTDYAITGAGTTNKIDLAKCN
jgi:hypothetical protein